MKFEEKEKGEDGGRSDLMENNVRERQVDHLMSCRHAEGQMRATSSRSRDMHRIQHTHTQTHTHAQIRRQSNQVHRFRGRRCR